MKYGKSIRLSAIKGGENMLKQKLLKRLHRIIIEIAIANDKELDKIGVELAEIEKALINYTQKPTNKKD